MCHPTKHTCHYSKCYATVIYRFFELSCNGSLQRSKSTKPKGFFFQLSFRLRTHYGTYLEVARVSICYSAQHVIEMTNTCIIIWPCPWKGKKLKTVKLIVLKKYVVLELHLHRIINQFPHLSTM